MSANIIIADGHCRYCPRQLSAALIKTGQFGNKEAGYTCPDCVVKLHFGYQRLGQRWTDESKIEVDMPADASPSPCVMCGSVMSEYYRSVWIGIDNEVEWVCADPVPGRHPCEMKWYEKNREKVGPIGQAALKLK